MNDADLDALLAAAAPIDDADLAALPLSGPDTDLCEAIMSTPVIDGIEAGGTTAGETPTLPGRRRRRFRPTRVGMAAAAAAAVAVAMTIGPFGSDDDPAWAAEAEAVAESVPRLLITADGWEIDGAPQFLTDEVNLDYRNADGVRISLSSRRDAPPEAAVVADGLTYESIVETHEDMDPDRIDRLADATVAGQPGVVFVTEREAEPYFDSFSDHGDFTVQVLGFVRRDGSATGLGEDEFREVLASIESVDVDTWLAAMPQDVTG